jgi:DNA mismatch endonuclease (patch repair protein)
MDVLTPLQRSLCMSRIRGRNTRPEIALRAALWSLGLRYRLHYPVPGRPDVVFPRQHVAVFVDGCFWHGCPVHSVKPKSNTAFWKEKLGKNIERDRRNESKLIELGWMFVRFWEHELDRRPMECAAVVLALLEKNRLRPARETCKSG